jgi:hypothetical protein
MKMKGTGYFVALHTSSSVSAATFAATILVMYRKKKTLFLSHIFNNFTIYSNIVGRNCVFTVFT